MLTVRVQGDGLRRFEAACRRLGEPKARAAYRRGINRTNDQAFTQVKRALARQVGLTQSKLVSLGGLRKERATGAGLSASIRSSGGYLSLKEFGTKQFSYGVRAKPWGVSRRFRSAFIFSGTPHSGEPVAGGHVFVRSSSRSLPIEKMFGPAIPNEMVKGESRAAWQGKADMLPTRIAHEVHVLTDGVVS